MIILLIKHICLPRTDSCSLHNKSSFCCRYICNFTKTCTEIDVWLTVLQSWLLFDQLVLPPNPNPILHRLWLTAVSTGFLCLGVVSIHFTIFFIRVFFFLYIEQFGGEVHYYRTPSVDGSYWGTETHSLHHGQCIINKYRSLKSELYIMFIFIINNHLKFASTISQWDVIEGMMLFFPAVRGNWSDVSHYNKGDRAVVWYFWISHCRN